MLETAIMANSTDFLLALENVSVSFDGFKAVNALNLYVDKGELRVIIGPNGAGKTTVLDLICGRTRVSDGSIKFKNQEITGRKEQEIVRLGIGRKFQTPTIYEDLTVFENLELSLPRGRNVAGALFWKRTEEVREQVKDVAAMIFLQDHLDRLAETLSHGQKQWLEIGMLLIQDPELLMLDEPVAGMSVSERAKTAELLKQIIKNRSVIVIEHDMKFVRASRTASPFCTKARCWPKATCSRCRRTRGSRKSISVIKEQKMFEVRNLSAAYGQSQALHGIDLSVGRGEIVALVGRNGMGKSTLMKSLIGVMPARSGQIPVHRFNVTALPSHRRFASGLAYVPQGRQIFGTMTVKENIETGLVVTGKSDVPSEIYDLFPILKDFERRRGGNLSGGQQQQLAIARALASDPKVLLLDEPTEGIQPSIIKDIARLLRDIRNIRNLCIVVCEQLLSFVLDIADRILVMEGGRIVHADTRDHVDEAAIARFLAV